MLAAGMAPQLNVAGPGPGPGRGLAACQEPQWMGMCNGCGRQFTHAPALTQHQKRCLEKRWKAAPGQSSGGQLGLGGVRLSDVTSQDHIVLPMSGMALKRSPAAQGSAPKCMGATPAAAVRVSKPSVARKRARCADLESNANRMRRIRLSTVAPDDEDANLINAALRSLSQRFYSNGGGAEQPIQYFMGVAEFPAWWKICPACDRMFTHPPAFTSHQSSCSKRKAAAGAPWKQAAHQSQADPPQCGPMPHGLLPVISGNAQGMPSMTKLSAQLQKPADPARILSAMESRLPHQDGSKIIQPACTAGSPPRKKKPASPIVVRSGTKTAATEAEKQHWQQHGRVTRFRGVHWHKKKAKWTAEVTIMGKKQYLGNFDDELLAAQAYDKAVQLAGYPGRANKHYGASEHSALPGAETHSTDSLILSAPAVAVPPSPVTANAEQESTAGVPVNRPMESTAVDRQPQHLNDCMPLPKDKASGSESADPGT